MGRVSDIIKRVVFLLTVILVTTIYQQTKLWDEANPIVTEQYKILLDEYIPIPTGDSEQKLRELAYEVEVSTEELEVIRNELAETRPYYFTNRENMRLAHFYSVIMNRYEPNEAYRDTAILAEYVFDGVLERTQLHKSPKLNPELYVTLFDTLSKMEQAKQDEALHRVTEDFKFYADNETKEVVYGWQDLEHTYDVATEYLTVQQKFYDALK